MSRSKQSSNRRRGQISNNNNNKNTSPTTSPSQDVGAPIIDLNQIDIEEQQRIFNQIVEASKKQQEDPAINLNNSHNDNKKKKKQSDMVVDTVIVDQLARALQEKEDLYFALHVAQNVDCNSSSDELIDSFKSGRRSSGRSPYTKLNVGYGAYQASHYIPPVHDDNDDYDMYNYDEISEDEEYEELINKYERW